MKRTVPTIVLISIILFFLMLGIFLIAANTGTIVNIVGSITFNLLNKLAT